MSLLLDTDALLFCLEAPGTLRPEIRRRIETPDEMILVSAVTVWEIELKRSLGKLRAPEDLEHRLREKRFTELPLRLRHVAVLAGLPALHRDPFDRLLVAQALADDLTIVTSDEKVRAYPVKSLRAR